MLTDFHPLILILDIVCLIVIVAAGWVIAHFVIRAFRRGRGQESGRSGSRS